MLATSASLPIARASGTSRASPNVRRPSLASSHESVSSGSRRSLRGVPAASAVACRLPGMSSTRAPCAFICTVFAGLVDDGAMIVARSPPAAA